jgi:hypothetical protein
MKSISLRVRAAALLLGLAVAACDSPSEPGAGRTEEVGVVVNSLDHSVTIFRVDDSSVRATVGVGPDGSPVTVAARAGFAVVPLGFVPAAAVVDLVSGTLARTVALPPNSGATGVAFLNDSIAVVANSNLNTVSPINVRSGQRGPDVAVGTFPQFVLAVGDTVWVLNAEIGSDFQPKGPGTVSVLTGSPLRLAKTITLSGTNPGAAAIGAGNRVFVVNSGRFGRAEGTVSVLDRRTLAETAHQTGFRSFPGSIAMKGALAYVGGFDIGVLVWNTETGAFVRGAGDPIRPGGVASVSGLGVDAEARVYALKPECAKPSSAYRMTEAFAVETEIPVGTCPLAVVFTRITDPDA